MRCITRDVRDRVRELERGTPGKFSRVDSAGVTIGTSAATLEDLETLAPGRASYRVFSADGELLGVAELPRARIREIGNDYVLALARDADDVEYVEMCRLRRRTTDQAR